MKLSEFNMNLGDVGRKHTKEGIEDMKEEGKSIAQNF